MGLLGTGDSQPVIAERMGACAPVLFICDHAGREVPRHLGRLGLSEAAFDSHIAWDIGAGGVTRRLAASAGATCVLQRYSRLVIDCNRDPARPDAIPAMSDGIAIPANAGLDAKQRLARIEAIHAPYHAAISDELDRRRDQNLPTILVFLHSFTPCLAGVQRPWHFGVIREPSSRFSEAVLEQLRDLHGLEVGDNEPYAMDGVDYSAPTHALARGLDYLELEMRQDLIADDAGQRAVGDLLQVVLAKAAARL
jgi:predicted N-formylglutamate amidohydrolase